MFRTGIYSPVLGSGLRIVQFEDFDGFTHERDLDGDERAVSECCH